MKESFALAVVVDFILNAWSFNFFIELFIVPIAVIITGVYVYSERKKELASVKKLCKYIFMIYAIAVVLRACVHLITDVSVLLNILSLKEFVFPIFILIINFPLIYGLSLYSIYEQIFILMNKNKFKKKIAIIKFAKVSITKAYAARTDSDIILSLIESEEANLKKNLIKLKYKLNLKIGDNYMKRSNFYIIMSSLFLIIFTTILGFSSKIFLISPLLYQYKNIIINTSGFGLLLSIFSLILMLSLNLRVTIV